MMFRLNKNNAKAEGLKNMHPSITRYHAEINIGYINIQRVFFYTETIAFSVVHIQLFKVKSNNT